MLIVALSVLACEKSQGGTIAYWRFQPGNLGADSSGNGNTLTVNNLTSSTNADANAPDTNSVVFDGSTSWAVTAANLDLTPYPTFTIEWFMQSTQTGWGLICILSPDINNNWNNFIIDQNEKPGDLLYVSHFLGENTETVVPDFSAPIADGQWHHYAATMDTTDSTSVYATEIWVDGILDTNFVSPNIPTVGSKGPMGSYPFYIGAYEGGTEGFFQGQMADMRISSGVLSPDQFLIHLSYPNAQIGITSQPASQSITLGGIASAFAVGVSVTNMNPQAVLYQWQSVAPGGNQWTNIPGQVTWSIPGSLTATVPSGTQYRVIVSVPGGTNITSQAATLTITAPTSSVIAYWQFQPGNLTADSSGNGNTLEGGGLISSTNTDANAPDTNSVAFDGSTSWAATVNAMNFGVYPAFTVEWFMQRPAASPTGIIFMLSLDYMTFGPASTFFSGCDFSYPGQWVWSTHDASDGGFFDSDPTITYPLDQAWHHYAVTVNTVVTNVNQWTPRLTQWIDGILVGSNGLYNSSSSAPFGDYQFLIGNGYYGAPYGTSYLFQGQFDDWRVSAGVLTPDQFLIHANYPGAQITITNQPASMVADPSVEQATFTVGVSATNVPLNAVLYQWQMELPGSSQWTNIPGAILPTYGVGGLGAANNGTLYRVLVQAPGATNVITSQAATLTTPVFSVAATNGAVILSWNYGVLQQTTLLSGTWQDIANATSPYSVKVTNSVSSQFFRLRY
jgi:hypothetical protein